MLSIRCNSGVNHEKIDKHSERITKIKPFINEYNWEGIKFPSEKDDWKKFEKNNRAIALNVLILDCICAKIFCLCFET